MRQRTDEQQVLAIGFLLVILSAALYKNFLTLLVVATYVVAPLPNWICGRCANPDDFIDSGAGSAAVDFGRFLTGFLVVMGVGTSTYYIAISLATNGRGENVFILEQCMLTCHATALPALLSHCDLISVPAMIMSICGGLLIYGTIISFSMFFQEEEEF